MKVHFGLKTYSSGLGSAIPTLFVGYGAMVLATNIKNETLESLLQESEG
jgi:NADP-dependent 3-hydroxy acid dehydrogenase YdfG